MVALNRLLHLFRAEPTPAEPKPPAIPRTGLEEKQLLLSHMVRMVARGVSHGLFVAGQGGLGKSRVISKTLEAEGIAPVLVNSHCTPLALFKLLHDHRSDKVVWLDDCDSIYGNLQVLGLLRSALWGQGQRVVTYNSSQLDGLPSSFVFDSRIIFCANSVPRNNPAFLAVLSRVDCFTLAASNDQVIEQMKTLATDGYGSLTAAQCLEVVHFIEQAAATRQLSMRIYEPSLRKVIYANQNGIDWRDLVRCQLDQLGVETEAANGDARDLDLAALAEAILAHPESVRGQETHWCHARKKSRASFFRVKKAFEEQHPTAHQEPPHEPTV